METFLEQTLEPGSQFLAGELNAVIGFGSKVEKFAIQPAGFVSDLAIVDVPGQLNEQRKRYVSRSESALARNAPLAAFRVGIRWRRPDNRDVKRRMWSLRSRCRVNQKDER